MWFTGTNFRLRIAGQKELDEYVLNFPFDQRGRSGEARSLTKNWN